MVIVSGKEALLHTFTDTYMLLHFFFCLFKVLIQNEDWSAFVMNYIPRLSCSKKIGEAQN